MTSCRPALRGVSSSADWNEWEQNMIHFPLPLTALFK
jgi:hypothetical protein